MAERQTFILRVSSLSHSYRVNPAPAPPLRLISSNLLGTLFNIYLLFDLPVHIFLHQYMMRSSGTAWMLKEGRRESPYHLYLVFPFFFFFFFFLSLFAFRIASHLFHSSPISALLFFNPAISRSKKVGYNHSISQRMHESSSCICQSNLSAPWLYVLSHLLRSHIILLILITASRFDSVFAISSFVSH